MATLSRRLFSTTTRTLTSNPPLSASSTASSFLTTHSTTTTTLTQLLDSNQTHLLHHTLDRPLPTSPLLPAGYHLAYFTPTLSTSSLGLDGTDPTFNPPPPFTRRMWAGGAMTWSRNALFVGQTATETTQVLSAKGTRTAAGDEMVVVGVSKTFSNDAGVALVDERNWLFLQPTRLSVPPTIPCAVIPSVPVPKPAIFASATDFAYYRDYFQTPASLFRFSALTFNGHRIHYDPAYAFTEGHRAAVVHGPLNLVLMLDLWRDARAARGMGRRGEVGVVEGEAVLPRRIRYRNTRPVYVGEWYRIGMGEEVEGVSELKLVDGSGKVCMVGTVEAFGDEE